MKRRRSTIAIVLWTLAASAAPIATASGGTGWVSCGSDPARIAFDIQTRGLGCSAVKPLLKKLQSFSHVKVVVARREFSYVATGWLCYYETSHSAKAQDGELSSFDCRMTAGAGGAGSPEEIRWTDAAAVKPVELLPK